LQRRRFGPKGSADARGQFLWRRRLDDVVIEQIDIGLEDAPAIFTREAALAWVLRRTALALE
jgi:hypothetical protein